MHLASLCAGLAALLVVFSMSGCGGGSNACSDGIDNDGDGLIDGNDPACEINGDQESPDSACSDRTDNDGDGFIDSEDPGCSDPTDNDETDDMVSQCQDGIDNDGDGLVDFPDDPGCAFSLSDSETDDCPDGTSCPACANGIDDDGDGAADYPDDLGCDSAADADEFNADPNICGGTVPLLALPASGLAMGTSIANMPNSLISQGCGGTGTETAYLVTVATASALEFTTDFPETTVDTVLYLRSDCRMPDTELGCNDDAQGTFASRLFIPRVEPGDYYLIVDSQPTPSGEYTLQMTSYTPAGESCNPAAANCAPNLSCEGSAGSETCQQPITGPTCNDNGTIRAKNVPTMGDLVISEYMANPNQVDDAQGEWFELRANVAVDLGGLELGRAEPPVMPGPILLTLPQNDCLPVAAGAHVLFARNPDTGSNGGLPVVDYVFAFDVANSNDGLFIGVNGTVLDVRTYTSTDTGKSTNIDPSGSGTCAATGTYGLGDFGTPRAANPACP